MQCGTGVRETSGATGLGAAATATYPWRMATNPAQDVARQLTTRGPELGGGAIRQLCEAAINGVGRVPGAKTVAAQQLLRTGDADAAIDALVSLHVSAAAAQGFVTNLGGIATLALALPANIAGLAIVQIRLIASVAHLRGYDVDDPRVRTAMVLCLMGRDGVLRLMESNVLPTTPVAIATAPVFDPSLDKLVAEKVFGELASRIGGRRAATMIARRIPLVGGGVVAGLDGFSTWEVGTYAKAQFVTRRRLTQG